MMPQCLFTHSSSALCDSAAPLHQCWRGIVLCPFPSAFMHSLLILYAVGQILLPCTNHVLYVLLGQLFLQHHLASTLTHVLT